MVARGIAATLCPRRGWTSLALAALVPAAVKAKGAGVWIDPVHYNPGSGSLAGVRVVAESPPHHLVLVGTDDGKDWWALDGTCGGDAMTSIVVDFSPKGGPADLTGTWAKGENGPATITWPDHNVWTMLEAPTAAWARADGVDDHVGLFIDPNHYSGTTSFAGTRYISEFPPHTLVVVGTDETPDPTYGKGLWAVRGNCSGEEMTDILLDFSPINGAVAGRGTWVSAEVQTDRGTRCPAHIAWSNGNTWSKIGGVVCPLAALVVTAAAAEPQVGRSGVASMRGFAVGVAAAAAALLVLRAVRARRIAEDGARRFRDDGL